VQTVSTTRRSRLLGSAMSAAWLLCGIACATDPKPLPTLLVTNATCGAGTCRTLEIRAFVNAFKVPGQPPDGFEVVGYAHDNSACLIFPSRWRLAVIADGTTDTAWATWTPSNTSGIELYAVDSTLLAGGGNRAVRDSAQQALWPFVGGLPGIIASTSEFVPGTAPGWSVTFPARSASGTAEPGLAATTTACAP
jgi:hypothetical protein